MTFDHKPEQYIDSAPMDVVPRLGDSSAEVKPLEQWAVRRVTLTLNQLSFFAAVAKHRNLTKASVELRVSQPSITQQLKQLENHHGAQLYRRATKGVEITEAGQRFLQRITPILDQVAKLEGGSVPRAAKTFPEALRVGGTDGIAAVLLPALLADFHRRHPSVDVEMRTGVSDQLEQQVLRSRIEIAVTLRAARSNQLASEPYGRERVVMFVPTDHPLANRNSLKLSDVLGEALITRGGSGASGVIDKALKQIRDAGLEVKVAMYCDGPTAIKAAVRHNMGVGMLYENAIKAEVANGEFKILDIAGLELEGESFIVYSKNKPLSPWAQEFLESLRAARAREHELVSASAGLRESVGPNKYSYSERPGIRQRQARALAL